jgi:nitrite reductase (NADH) small subunit
MSDWTDVCHVKDLTPARGAAVLLPGDEQVALFRTVDDEVFALSNVDPFSGAAVLSRGIVGDVGGVPVVASPIYKQHFVLGTGACVDAPEMSVRTYPVRVEGGRILVRSR